MDDHNPAAAQPSSGEPEAYRDSDLQSPGPVRGRSRSWGQRFRLLLLRVLALLATFTLFAVILTGAAGWYTSRPQFCSSCHIMEPYYTSWQTSTHHDVSCIKCHFPPGAGEKVRGKLLGLVQLAQYVTRSEGPRPAAEIPDASCLRTGCHETRLLAGRVNFQGIPFDHQPHLGELRRGKQLRCTSCHSQIVQGAHMTVTPSTCFLCHFKGGFFNQGLGACTRCHQIPDKEFDLGGGVKFDHNLAYEKGVDCARCHADLIRGDGEVPLERCGVCHNREDDLKRINEHDFLHQMHVADHNIDCLSCHLQIHHSLDPHKIANAAADCSSCHPNHHRAQVELLTGTGSHTVPAHLTSGMATVRIACPTCHRIKEVSSTGTVLMRASLQTCTACHDAAQTADLEAYHKQFRDLVPKLAANMKRVREAATTAELPADRKAVLEKQLSELQYDVDFVAVGNEIHNSHYASNLMNGVVQQLTPICKELGIDPPEVKLPPPPVSVAPSAKKAATTATSTSTPTAFQQPPPPPDAKPKITPKPQLAPAGPKPTEAKPADAKPAENKPGETKPPETKPTESKSAEAKPAKAAEAKPAETKPAEVKPAETKPADAKPAETKPAETQPVDAKPADKKATEAKPAEAQPAEKQPTEAKPAEKKGP